MFDLSELLVPAEDREVTEDVTEDKETGRDLPDEMENLMFL